MKTPFKFKYLNKTWTIKLIKNLCDFNGDPLYGQCNFRNKSIKVESDICMKSKKFTLFHELLHLAFPHGVVSEKTEEKIVQAMEDSLLEILEDVGWLKKTFSIQKDDNT